MRPGRTVQGVAPASPAEELVEEMGMPSSFALMSEEEEGPIVRPFEPKGEQGAEPEDTVVGVDLIFSPPPPKTAGGTAPATKNSFGRWTRDE